MVGLCYLLHIKIYMFLWDILYALGWLLITSCFPLDENTWGAKTNNFTFLFIVKIKPKPEGKNWGWSQSAPGQTCFRAYLTLVKLINNDIFLPVFAGLA